MNLKPLTPEGLKQQARRLRDYLAEKNIDISHAMALETLAKQYGYKDWNVLSATLGRQKQHKDWPELEGNVKGTYLGHAFTGKILKLQTSPHADIRRYTFLFDEAIDVVKSSYFSSYRKRVSCYLDQNLTSVDHKGRPDNILKLL